MSAQTYKKSSLPTAQHITKVRGFEIAQGWENQQIELPARSTSGSAGYDIAAAADTIIPKFTLGTPPTLVPTGLKVYCQPDECLLLYNRSSNPGRSLILANGVGVVDADFYNNSANDGHFQILLFNLGSKDIMIKKGERVAQAIFQKFLLVDRDQTKNTRQGGIGSTGIGGNNE